MSTAVLATPKKAKTSQLETVLVDADFIASLADPPIQRPVTKGAKFWQGVEKLKQTEQLPGIIHIGVLRGQKYKLDGQHRLTMFSVSGLKECLADTRTLFFDSMGEMAEAMDGLNDHFSAFRPDDHLRALQFALPPLSYLKQACDFIGFGSIRKGEGSTPILSMSMVLRVWAGAATDMPTTKMGMSATALAKALTEYESKLLGGFLSLCFKAWGRDAEYGKLWCGLNLSICAWFYRHAVIKRDDDKQTTITREVFLECLRDLQADSTYVRFLDGRLLSDMHRGPCYRKALKVFASRLARETKKTPVLPSPPWSKSK